MGMRPFTFRFTGHSVWIGYRTCECVGCTNAGVKDWEHAVRYWQKDMQHVAYYHASGGARVMPTPRNIEFIDTTGERTYRIHHRPSHRWFDVKADSAAEAVRLGGADWRMEDCWVRQYTDRGGWGKVRR